MRMVKPDGDLAEMGLTHKYSETAWKHIKKGGSHLPTSASSWINHLKSQYNEGVLDRYTACPQNAIGATELTSHDITGAIKKLAKGKASGPDGVWSNISSGQAPLLTELWCGIAKEGAMPRFLNDALICPIHKKGDTNNPANFRPISLLNTAVKIFETAVLDKYRETFNGEVRNIRIQKGTKRLRPNRGRNGTPRPGQTRNLMMPWVPMSKGVRLATEPGPVQHLPDLPKD